MIPGFEDETAPLSNEEMTAAMMFAKSFEKRIGEHNAITSGEITNAMKKVGFDLAGSRIRKIVNYIRRTKMVKNLVATSKGYYIENDPEKLAIYISSLKARAEAIMAVADSYK